MTFLRSWGWRAGVVLGVAAGASACSGSSTTATNGGGGASSARGAGPHACSPLEGKTEAITLARVLGAGRHADGTVYVLDDGAPSYRAFVSAGTVLQRKEVSGSGTEGGASGPGAITATVRDASPFALQIERQDGAATRMGVYRGELPGKSFAIGAEGDVLELVGADVLAGFEVRNIAAEVLVEYDATTQDGHRIFVTRPKVDAKMEDFRVFYGTPSEMKERRLANASRGSTTFLTFDLDGVETTAIFPSQHSPVSDTARLASGPTGPSQPLTVLATDAGVPGAGLSFVCL